MTSRANLHSGSGSDVTLAALRYPVITIHQLYVSQLDLDPQEAPHNGLIIPKWLFQRAGLQYGEKATLTREQGAARDVDPLRNRTVTPLFPGDHFCAVTALGPTAKFLGQAGPSCCIVFAEYDDPESAATIDLSFPFENSRNSERDIVIRTSGIGELNTKSGNLCGPALQRGPERLVASISGLVVQAGEPFCNPLLAQIPVEIMRRALLPARSVEAFFSSPTRDIPALQGYVVPSKSALVCMSGALFGAFPIRSEVVIDVYGRGGSTDAAPRFLHVGAQL